MILVSILGFSVLVYSMRGVFIHGNCHSTVELWAEVLGIGALFPVAVGQHDHIYIYTHIIRITYTDRCIPSP